MINLGPAPKNRIYTNFNSYGMFVNNALRNRFHADGQDIEKFEKALSDRFGTQHAVCTYQCRVGIYLVIKALIQPGQEIVLSPYTVADVINMVIFAGGRPVFADVDRDTCNISAAEVERLIHENTGAVLITHLNGLAADAHRIKAICDRFNVPMIEDAAQAFGVYEQGKPVTTIGDAGVFSFGMHKNLNTWLGGAVLTNRADIAEKVRMGLEEFSTSPLASIAQKVKLGLIHNVASAPVLFQALTYPILRRSYLKSIEFVNEKVRRKPQESQSATELPKEYQSRYTAFQARLGLSQLNRIDQDIKTRIEKALLYYEGLKDLDELVLSPFRLDGSNTYLWFPIQYSNREDLIRFLYRQGRDIAAGHLKNEADSPSFQAYHRDCPNAAKVQSDLIYLPTYPSYSRQDIERTIQAIRQYFATRVEAPVKQPAIAAN